MGLSCDCDFDFDYYADPDDDFSAAPRNLRCVSCGKKVVIGETVLKFTCHRAPDPDSGDPEDIEADKNGDEVWLPDEYHCERCGEIYMNLQEAGYCLSSGWHMPSLLKEYQKMTGFKPEKYQEPECLPR